MSKITCKKYMNARTAPINVQGKERQPGEIFEAEQDKEIKNLEREIFIAEVQ